MKKFLEILEALALISVIWLIWAVTSGLFLYFVCTTWRCK